MSYLSDFIYYTSGNECPERYRIWSALSLLGAVLGRKVWTWHGRFQVLPSLYVILVGDAGSGKSTAKNEAKKFFSNNFPDYLISASFQSHQDIIDQMCNASPKTWNLYAPDGSLLKINSFTSFYIVCNEFSSLLSTDKKGMVEFLVDIFDENEFSTGFKTQRTVNPEKKQKLENPYVNVLACAVPKWFMSNLKLDLFDGGLGRRLIIVYDERVGIVPHPMLPIGSDTAKDKVIAHLAAAEQYVGEIKRSLDAHNWWTEWYTKIKNANIQDPILSQFYQTKPIQVLKTALLLSMCEQPFSGQITTEHLQMAVALIDALEPNVIKLTSGIGRNELAGVGAQLMDYLGRMGGTTTVKAVKKFFYRYVNTPEFTEMLNHLIATGEIIPFTPLNNPTEGILFLPDAYEAHCKMTEKITGLPAPRSSCDGEQP